MKITLKKDIKDIKDNKLLYDYDLNNNINNNIIENNSNNINNNTI